MSWFRRKLRVAPSVVRTVYAGVVAAARRPVFHELCGVPDSLDGRFDVLCLHAFLAMRRLKVIGTDESKALSQALFDAMFLDMEAALRQIGVSDLRVGQEIKAMARAFLGRVEAYDAAFVIGGGEALSCALARNVFRGDDKDGLAIVALTRYMEAADVALSTQPNAQVMGGALAFPDFLLSPDPD
ncbi:MAG: ubiquinol-cytochrome C chaperone family protein [Rhodospirillaceae bacterium]|nr:ubiquinol-cytochrome C chaperone family protein [Rhodospirillaceae bacterium]